MAARGDAPGRVLIVSPRSFLARHLLAVMPAARVQTVGHGAIERPGLLDGVSSVVTFSRHPLVGREDYRLDEMDPDLRLARRIGERAIAYVMLSSRKVYARRPGPLAEDAPSGPEDAYGRHKLAVEEALRARLGERLTVLRLANVFGYERTPGRATFLSILLDRLARAGEIRFEMSPFVERDFLPVERFAALLARIAPAPPGGTLNVGSGVGLATGRLALWIIEGYGRGRLVIDSPVEKDPFVLDVSRLRTRYGAPCTLEDLRTTCLHLGRRLAKEAP